MEHFLTFKTKISQLYFQEKISFEMSPFELKRKLKTNEPNILLIDLRNKEDFLKSHVKNSINIEFDCLENNFDRLCKDKINVFLGYSQFCKLAPKACYIASYKGYPSMELMGGFHTIEKLDFELISQ